MGESEAINLSLPPDHSQAASSVDYGPRRAKENSCSIRLAVVILTKNEEHNIADCIESVRWADEVVVFDSFSKDRTVEIAQELGAQVIQHPFRNYAEQRNAALEAVESQWIFFVDADERATPELATEVWQAIEDETKAGWWVPRHNYIFGRLTRHAGWFPDYQLRLLKRGHARYDPAREVHEVVILDGQEGHLKNVLIHYNYENLPQFLERQNRYTDYEARILYEQGIRPKWRNFILQPLREFRRRYVSLQGWKDGFHGLLLCGLMAYYNFVMYVRLRRLWRTLT
jgi:(heptosyl)LPS beta-1,4-glucosyltransferase